MTAAHEADENSYADRDSDSDEGTMSDLLTDAA